MQRFLSGRFRQRYPNGDHEKARARYVDHLLSTWRVHHLHLSMEENRKGRNQRTDDLLFVRFTDDAAYLLTVLPHDRHFADKRIPEILYRNWPSAGFVMTAREGVRLTQDYSDESRLHLQQAGVVTAVEVDGRVLFPPMGGQSLNGMSAAVTIRVNEFLWQLAQLRKQLVDNPAHLDDTVFRDRGIQGPFEWTPVEKSGRYGLATKGGKTHHLIMFTDVSPMHRAY